MSASGSEFSAARRASTYGTVAPQVVLIRDHRSAYMDGQPLDRFLELYPQVSRPQAVAALEEIKSLLAVSG